MRARADASRSGTRTHSPHPTSHGPGAATVGTGGGADSSVRAPQPTSHGPYGVGTVRPTGAVAPHLGEGVPALTPGAARGLHRQAQWELPVSSLTEPLTKEQLIALLSNLCVVVHCAHIGWS